MKELCLRKKEPIVEHWERAKRYLIVEYWVAASWRSLLMYCKCITSNLKSLCLYSKSELIVFSWIVEEAGVNIKNSILWFYLAKNQKLINEKCIKKIIAKDNTLLMRLQVLLLVLHLALLV